MKPYGADHFLDVASYIAEQVQDGRNCAKLANELGWSASKVRHYYRIHRKLAPAVKELCYSNQHLSEGHAKALCQLKPEAQEEKAREVLARHVSVRRLEASLKGTVRDKDTEYLNQLSRRLSDMSGRPITITKDAQHANAGNLVFRYFDIDDFSSLCEQLGLDLDTAAY